MSSIWCCEDCILLYLPFVMDIHRYNIYIYAWIFIIIRFPQIRFSQTECYVRGMGILTICDIKSYQCVNIQGTKRAATVYELLKQELTDTRYFQIYGGNSKLSETLIQLPSERKTLEVIEKWVPRILSHLSKSHNHGNGWLSYFHDRVMIVHWIWIVDISS